MTRTVTIPRNDLAIGIASCDRCPQYIAHTLGELYGRCDEPPLHEVTVFVCGPTAAYIDPKVMHKKATVHVLDAPAWHHVRALRPKHRTAHTFYRILASDSNGVIALQDDLDFASRWLERARKIIGRLDERFDHAADAAYALSLYYPYRHEGYPELPPALGCVPYEPKRFYGTQAVYLSPAARGLVAGHMLGRFVTACIEPDDMMLKDALLDHQIPLYGAVPSLVQHIGIASSVEQRFHESPVFDAP